MITLEALEEMFEKIRAETSWHVDGDMLWGYFFAGRDRNRLEGLATHLGRNGYRVVGIDPTDDDDLTMLHVERIERHTPETLDKRNKEFCKLAEEYGVETYDGMDVGPAKNN